MISKINSVTNPMFSGSLNMVGPKGEEMVVYDPKNKVTATPYYDGKITAGFTVKFNDKKFQNLSVMVKEDGVFRSKDGDLFVSIKKPSGSLAFKGTLYGSIGVPDHSKVQDAGQKNCYTSFFANGLYDATLKYVDKKEATKVKDDYNFFVPTDGDGTRFKDISEMLHVPSKTQAFIPAKLNNQQMTLSQGVFMNFARTGKLDNSLGLIPVKPAQGSAYAFLEGLKSGMIPTDKPLVFSWGDNFSDINIVKLMQAHEKANSDFTLLTLPVDDQRIKALGAAAVKSKYDMSVKEFIEKPKTAAEVKRVIIPGTEHQCLAVVGPYILSSNTLNWIKETYTENPDAFKSNGVYDFSSKVLKQLNEKINANDAFRPDGSPMKMMAYAKPADESWSDLGAHKDFASEMRKIKSGIGFKYLPKEVKDSIKKNIDKDGNIAFTEKSQKALNKVRKEYDLEVKNTLVYQA